MLLCGGLSVTTCGAPFGTQLLGIVVGVTEQITAAAFVSMLVEVLVDVAAGGRRGGVHHVGDDVRRNQSSGERRRDLAPWRPHDHHGRVVRSISM